MNNVLVAMLLEAVNHDRVKKGSQPLSDVQAQKGYEEWSLGRSNYSRLADFLTDYQPVCDLGKVEFNMSSDVQAK